MRGNGALYTSDTAEHYTPAHAAGAVPEAIALVPARVDAAWWRRLASACALVLFFSGRLRFVGNDNSAPFPSALCYLGCNHDRFLEVTNGRGDVWQKVYSNATEGL